MGMGNKGWGIFEKRRVCHMRMVWEPGVDMNFIRFSTKSLPKSTL